MVRSIRHFAKLGALLPLFLFAAACGDDTSGDTADAATKEAGSGNDSGGTTDGASDGGADGASDGGADGADGALPDDSAPTVVSTSPAPAATGAPVNAAITADFSEAMAAATLTDATFTLKEGAVDVTGAVTYSDATATFTPATALALDTTYTASISTAATDLAGNALGAIYTWSFTTDATAPIGPKPVLLGAAGKYVVLAKSAITNVPTSVVTGNVALSPAAASYITGFGLTKAGTKWTSPQVIGGVFAADNDPPTPSNLTTAIGDMQTAYTDAAGRPTPDFTNLGAGTVGSVTLAPGLYTWSSSVTIPTDITLAGAANDVWIFQIAGDLTMSAAKAMTLSGGAKAKNVFWQVAGFVQLGTTAHAEGIVMSKTAITLGTGASINGRLLAQTAVTLASSTVTAPAK